MAVLLILGLILFPFVGFFSLLYLGFFNNYIKNQLCDELEESLACPSRIERLDLDLNNAKIDIHGLVLDNPSGQEYGSHSMVVLKHVVLDFNFQALLTSLKLNIEKVHIKKAEIVYSGNLEKSNLKWLINHLNEEEAEPAQKYEPKEEAGAVSKIQAAGAGLLAYMLSTFSCDDVQFEDIAVSFKLRDVPDFVIQKTKDYRLTVPNIKTSIGKCSKKVAVTAKSRGVGGPSTAPREVNSKEATSEIVATLVLSAKNAVVHHIQDIIVNFSPAEAIEEVVEEAQVSGVTMLGSALGQEEEVDEILADGKVESHEVLGLLHGAVFGKKQEVTQQTMTTTPGKVTTTTTTVTNSKVAAAAVGMQDAMADGKLEVHEVTDVISGLFKKPQNPAKPVAVKVEVAPPLQEGEGSAPPLEDAGDRIDGHPTTLGKPQQVGGQVVGHEASGVLSDFFGLKSDEEQGSSSGHVQETNEDAAAEDMDSLAMVQEALKDGKLEAHEVSGVLQGVFGKGKKDKRDTKKSKKEGKSYEKWKDEPKKTGEEHELEADTRYSEAAGAASDVLPDGKRVDAAEIFDNMNSFFGRVRTPPLASVFGNEDEPRKSRSDMFDASVPAGSKSRGDLFDASVPAERRGSRSPPLVERKRSRSPASTAHSVQEVEAGEGPVITVPEQKPETRIFDEEDEKAAEKAEEVEKKETEALSNAEREMREAEKREQRKIARQKMAASEDNDMKEEKLGRVDPTALLDVVSGLFVQGRESEEEDAALVDDFVMVEKEMPDVLGPSESERAKQPKSVKATLEAAPLQADAHPRVEVAEVIITDDVIEENVEVKKEEIALPSLVDGTAEVIDVEPIIGAEVIIPDEVIEVADKDEVKTEALEADLTFVTPAAPAADEEEIIAVAASAVAVEEKDGVTVIEEKTAAVAAGEDNDVVVVEENVVTVKEEEEEVAQLAEEKVYKVEEAEEPVIEKVYGGKPEETPYVPFSYTSSRPEKVYGQPSTATSDSDDELDKMRTLASEKARASKAKVSNAFKSFF